MIATIINADCVRALARMPDNSIDAVVTDPPAGIEFMGAAWDTFKERDAYADGGRQTSEWDDNDGKNPFARRATPRFRGKKNASLLPFQDFIADAFSVVLRVLKPGGHGLVWALPRTSHHTAMGLERAGFDVRDVLMHLFGQGFPKSRNMEGEWEGWGTALKPGAEHWILIRKPFAGTVEENVAKWGVGALNIDGCRIEASGGRPLRVAVNNGLARGTFEGGAATGGGSRAAGDTTLGRWPANVTLDEEAAVTLDAQSGPRGALAQASGPARAGKSESRARNRMTGTGDTPAPFYGDQGGASRFYYVAKPGKKERNAGGLVDNNHPTVKPIELMRWLCRLITPPGGLVLDPFAGSGTTGVAASLEGLEFIGIEREKAYAEIARARIASVTREAA